MRTGGTSVAQISVIIPTYNRKNTVTRAIDSVLAQTIRDIECIVIDDASADGTHEVLQAYDDNRLTFIRHESNQGGSAARNTGIDASNGALIAFLDSDDTWKPRKLEIQLRRFESTDCVGVYCATQRSRQHLVKRLVELFFDEPTGLEGGAELINEVLSLRLAVHAGSTLLVDADIVKRINGFDETFVRHQDLEFLVRLLQNGHLAYVDEPLVILHESGYPSAETVVTAKRQLLSKYDDKVAAAEQAGYPIRAIHDFGLSKAYLREGRFRQGLETVPLAPGVNARQYASLVWAMMTGVKRLAT